MLAAFPVISKNRWSNSDNRQFSGVDCDGTGGFESPGSREAPKFSPVREAVKADRAGKRATVLSALRGYIDAHVSASVKPTPGSLPWTHDRRG